jgi:hypothetical protein
MLSRSVARFMRWFFPIAALLLFAALVYADNPSTPSKEVPMIDGEVGPCSVDFTVTDAADKPVYDAKIRVHIEHGFLKIRKLDLEVGTNADGKARFQGLPHTGNLFFQASKGKLKGVASVSPENDCHAKHTIVLVEP